MSRTTGFKLTAKLKERLVAAANEDDEVDAVRVRQACDRVPDGTVIEPRDSNGDVGEEDPEGIIDQAVDFYFGFWS